MDVDILAKKDGKTYAIEVVLSTERNEVAKLQNLANVDNVIFVCKNKHDAESLKSEFNKMDDLPAKPAWVICQISDVLNCDDLQKVGEKSG